MVEEEEKNLVIFLHRINDLGYQKEKKRRKKKIERDLR